MTVDWTKPVATPTTRTAAEMLDRMEALTRKVATWTWVGHTSGHEDLAEARAIVAEMTPPVDPLEAAIQAAMDNGNNVQAFEIAQAVRRQLEREGK